jgi:putative transposase
VASGYRPHPAPTGRRSGFFGRLKNEMFYNRSWFGVSLEEFCALLDDCIYWYNEKRIKMSLGGMSPLEYRRSRGLAS